MKKLTFTIRLFLLIALLLLPSATAMARAGAEKTYHAYAEFDVNPSGCHRTYVTVDVIEHVTHTPPGPPQSAVTVNLRYFVRSTCELGDFLFYWDLQTSGAVTIDPANFQINKGLRKATLNTILPVHDGESGTDMNFGVIVEWTASNTGTTATFEYYNVNLNLTGVPIVNPIPNAVNASLGKS